MVVNGSGYRTPFELEVFVEKASQGNDLTKRIDAIKELNSLMETYPLKNHSKICGVVQDLLQGHYPSSTRQPVYSLLASCVRRADLSPAERTMFFDTIASHADDQNFLNNLEILILLTRSGKSVQAVDTMLGAFLITLLRKSLNIIDTARSKRRKAKTSAIQGDLIRNTEEEILRPMLLYINDVIRFNSKIFKEEDTEALLTELLSICENTTSETIMQKATQTIENIVTYAYIPKMKLASCLRVLCDVYHQVQNLRESTWTTLNKIFGSHSGQLAVSELLNTLRHANGDTDINILRGELYVLHEVVIAKGLNGLPLVPLKVLLPSLANCAAIKQEKIDADILCFVAAMLKDEQLTQLLIEEDEWSNLSLILVRCAANCGYVSSGKGTILIKSETENTPVRFREELALNRNQIEEIFVFMNGLITRVPLGGESTLIMLLLQFSKILSDKTTGNLISYLKRKRLLSPSNTNWKEYFDRLYYGVYLDRKRIATVRASALSALTETFILFDSLAVPENVHLAQLLVDTIIYETDDIVLGTLAHFVLQLMGKNSEGVFQYTLSKVQKAMKHLNENYFLGRPNNNNKESRGSSATLECSALRILTNCVVSAFVKLLNVDASKSNQIFKILIEIAVSGDSEINCRLLVLKVLFCLRCDLNGSIYLVPSSEADSLAILLNRIANEDQLQYAEGIQSRHSRDSADVARQERLLMTEFTGSPRASLSRLSSRSSDSLAVSQKEPRSFWMHPGPPEFPEKPQTGPSPVTYIRQRPETVTSRESLPVLDMSLWLSSIICLLEREKNWEIYAYILVYLGAQLANRTLFCGSVEALKRLRVLVCDTVNNATYLEPRFSSRIRRSDITSCFYYVLTVLTGYHSIFKKEDLDDNVKTFLFGIGAGDYASRYSIHALAVCCYEVPLPLSKLLEPILQKMSQIITQAQVAVDILEFLANLARLDHVHRNFRDEEFKTVFGICFRYLQFVRDQRRVGSIAPLNRRSRDALRHSGGSRELRVRLSQDLAYQEASSSDDVPQYVYSLAYHVITFWFMALRLDERPKYMSWIKRNLSHINEFGKEVLEEQAVVTVDMMYRVAFSDRDETNSNSGFAKASDGDRNQRSWVTGTSIITIETCGRTGLSHITRRRPSSTRHSIFQPNLVDPPSHQASITTGLAAEAFYKSSYVGVRPEDIFQEFYSSLEMYENDSDLSQTITLLPKDETTHRAIGSLDRVSTLDSHKVGVIYIARQQTTEAIILSNTLGSPDYHYFLAGLGKLTRLKGTEFNTHGLDRDFDTDGEFTICWRDRVTELVFHVATLMPNNPIDDPNCTNKKKHVGNDFVNIIYNNSGTQFNFNTFPSEFNFIYIVITPEGRFSSRTTGIYDDNTAIQYFKVNVLTKPQFPRVSFAAETKLISSTALPTFVRLLALNASVFCHIWAKRDGDEYISSWRTRLRQIDTLRKRYSDKSGFLDNLRQPNSYSSSSAEPKTYAAHSMSIAVATRDNVPTFRRASASTTSGELRGLRSAISDLTLEGDRERPSTISP